MSKKITHTKTEKKTVLIHGHRGFRGLFPENTLAAFKAAADSGITVIEFDVVISADSQVVVSHEPWMLEKTCSMPDGKPVTNGRKYNLYKMNYTEIARFDCGKRGHADFPKQQKMPAIKPLLKDVIREMENYTKKNGLPEMQYNIEIKCLKPGDKRFHPKPAPFAKLVYDVIKPLRVSKRVFVQSFDLRVLEEMHELDSTLRYGILVMGPASFKNKVKKLGFKPFMYNPNYKQVDKKLLDEAHAAGIEVHPYTVNDTAEMRKLIKLGVDGLITDYPDRAKKILHR